MCCMVSEADWSYKDYSDWNLKYGANGINYQSSGTEYRPAYM